MADTITRHVLVVTEAHTAVSRMGYPVSVPVGLVQWVGMLGQSQIPVIGPPIPMREGKPVAALIEHATAVNLDVLPEADVTEGVATAKTKLAAMHAAADAARKKKPPTVPMPSVEDRLAALEAKTAALPAPAAE